MTKYLCIILIFILSACGLRPVYNKNSTLPSELMAIKVEQIDSIEGVEFYNTLSHLLTASIEPQYLLKVNIAYSSAPQAIQKNSDVIRGIAIEVLNYQLLDIHNGNLLTSGQLQLSSSYNNSFSPFGSYTEHDECNKTLVKYSAEQIRDRLILYFRSQQLKNTSSP